VDGVKIELKTANPDSDEVNVRASSTNAAVFGFNQQGAEVVILDLRFGVKEDPTALDIFTLYFYTATK
jgi:hypothetical protein